MCLLIACNPGITVPTEHLRNSAKRNSHGYGFAIYTPEGIVTYKSMILDETINLWEKLRAQFPEDEAIWHLRFATHGARTKENCHPFWVAGDSQTVLAHNGILPIKENDTKTSDSRQMAERLIPQFGGVKLTVEEKETWEIWMGSFNKVALLSANPDVPNLTIMNEHIGDWVDGTWYSNDSWKPPRVFSYTAGSMYPHWSDDTAWDWDTERHIGHTLRENGLPPYVRCKDCGWGYGHLDDCPNVLSWHKQQGKTRSQNRRAEAASVFLTATECNNCHNLLTTEAELEGQCSHCGACTDCGAMWGSCACNYITFYDGTGSIFRVAGSGEVEVLDEDQYNEELLEGKEEEEEGAQLFSFPSGSSHRMTDAEFANAEMDAASDAAMAREEEREYQTAAEAWQAGAEEYARWAESAEGTA